VTTEVPLPDIDAVTLSDWERILSVNVIGTFLVSPRSLTGQTVVVDGGLSLML